jgi:hypothetical protein
VILPMHGDGALYSGMLTYQSNSPVDVTVWNEVTLANNTSIPEVFGDIGDVGVIKGKTVVPTTIGSGTLGPVPFIASRPVDAIVLNLLKLGNTTAIPDEFGDLDDIVPLNGELVSISEIGSGSSGSLPFTGNAIGLTSDEGQPFLATYSANAFPTQGRINDTTSILDYIATATPVEEIEEDAEEDAEDE